jgi:hypothetical protein
MIDSAHLLSRTAKVPPPFETLQDIFDGRVIRWDFGPSYPPDLTTCDFNLWVCLKDKGL